VDRQEILDAIRQTATANGGKPLGMGRFFNATGIRPEDWEGRFWARWSDAVREAGFEPNTLQPAFDEGHVLDAYAVLIRKLGRLPTVNEVLLEKRSDPTLPSRTVLTRRFGLGTQTQVAAKVLEYCRRTPGYEDVAEICERRAAAEGDATSSRRPTKGTEADGFVYMLRSGRSYKIGRSNAFGRRERDLAIQLPNKPDTVHVIRTDDPPGIEAYWHERFKVKRRGGEWFELDAADVAAFRRRKFQ